MKQLIPFPLMLALSALGNSETSSLPNTNAKAAIQSVQELHREQMLRRFTLLQLITQTNEKLKQSDHRDSVVRELKSTLDRLNAELDLLNNELGPLRPGDAEPFLKCRIM